ncbi:D-amino acid dehydrogenase [Paucibacter soli]|uniref:D-amino acid dehydrogenase n=1 Tax=Paucibacter soli TaxID=3133433 RepID=UPI0030AF1F77
MSMMSSSKHVVVIGGGIVGLTSAWCLAEAGHRVSLVEREAALANGASRANGGQLSYRYVSPLADEGVPLKALRWLLDPDGPLRFKPEASWQQWSWLAAFLAKCRGPVNRRTTARLLALGAYSQTAFAQLQAETRLDAIALRSPGKLVLYRQPAEFGRVAARVRAAGDAAERALSHAECVALEPALAHSPAQLAGGIFTEGEAVADCHALALALAERLRSHPNFRAFVHAEVQGFVRRQGRVVGLRCEAGEIAGDEFVLAAGLQSRALAAELGIRLPIYPLKGYSLTAPIAADHLPPVVSVTDFEKKILYARIGAQLRVAAMVDLVGEDARIDPGRIASLQRAVRAMFPRAADYDSAETWAGLRPATPSGAPLLGATPVPGLWLNVGHGALGFTFSFGSARIVAELVSGRASPLSLDGLQLATP